MSEEIIKIKRADKLPASVQKKHGIYNGLVEIKIVSDPSKRNRVNKTGQSPVLQAFL